MIAIATLLNLSEKQEQDQEKVVAAVIRWLINHHSWLLILDNVEDPALIKHFLPPARNGSLLFTSRRQSLGLPSKIVDLERMTPEEGMLFLLHRTGLLNSRASLDSLPPIEKVLALEIVTVMDGLPLALDQAGAYIEATQCSLYDYLQLFRSSQLQLLDERDDQHEHPSSVKRTFALAFEQLERNNPIAAELLTVCAFLASEVIPDTFFLNGATHLGPTFEMLAADPLHFQNTLKILLTYSLRFYQRATTIIEQEFGFDHPQITYSLTNLGDAYREQGKYEQAEPLYRCALHIREQMLGLDHPNVADPLTGLAALLSEQGKYKEAEPLFQRALALRQEHLGTQHPLLAETLHHLARFHHLQYHIPEALSLYQQAQGIYEQVFGIEHLKTRKTQTDYVRILDEIAREKEANRDGNFSPGKTLR